MNPEHQQELTASIAIPGSEDIHASSPVSDSPVLGNGTHDRLHPADQPSYEPGLSASFGRSFAFLTLLFLLLAQTMSLATEPRRIKSLGAIDFNVALLHARLISYRSNIYFFAQTDTLGFGLWRTDGGSNAPVLVKDLGNSKLALPGPVEFSNRLFFVLSSRRVGTWGLSDYLDLWASDGTTTGTVLVRELSLHVNLFGFGNAAPIVSGDYLYFTGQHPDPPGGYTILWRSDGTSAGTRPLLNTAKTFPVLRSLTAYPGGIMFTAPSKTFNAGDVLWKSDGTVAGTVEVLDPAPQSSGNPFQLNMVAVNDRIFFRTPADPLLPSLWRTDGTVAGTTNWAGFLYDPIDLLVVGDQLLFFMDNGRLWSMGETPDSLTRLHEDLIAKSISSSLVHDGRLWLGVIAPDNRAQIWVTDGTASGTQPIATLNTSAEGFFALSDTLFFYGGDAEAGREIWRMDLTTSQVARITDIRAGPQSSIGAFWQGFAALESRLCFVATEDGLTYGLWVLDTETTPPVTLRLLPPERTVSGFRLQVQGPPSLGFHLERAPTVVGPWQSITNLTTDVSGNGEAEDATILPDGAFYRAVHP